MGQISFENPAQNSFFFLFPLFSPVILFFGPKGSSPQTPFAPSSFLCMGLGPFPAQQSATRLHLSNLVLATFAPAAQPTTAPRPLPQSPYGFLDLYFWNTQPR